MEWRPVSVEIQEPARFETQKKEERSLVSLSKEDALFPPLDAKRGKGREIPENKQTNNPL
jgi:hypothetical protein